ncbi:dihydroorotate dehydrogenase (quinone) [Marinicella sp. S1101]|uniref:dihydroorotate dehydrogenase (quinone) n=1 Tax=Marinicella marina TaxID=2996016 RepID=UPI002260FB2C|nr:dihydroorotate dehydrogenase (quinone) [Marinicella marina]MCX7553464.1 dihydroorotate dehydrogenase (quinone) [Marinicella marina]MDJ1140088.1 dihydroorotate dehydrogenase (quinone) [Marinicella marina]
MLEFFARKTLQALPAELAHDLAIQALGSPLSIFTKTKQIQNPVELMGIKFPNPVGLAAGFDKNGDAIHGLNKQGFGFLEIGTITPKPQAGNDKPRLFRLSADDAIINRMGFNNKGIDYLVKQVKKSAYKGILGINIGKNKTTPNEQALNDYIHCFEKARTWCDYITVNISSPNTPDLRELQNDQALIDLLSGIKTKQTELADKDGHYTPVVVKISPDQNKDQLEFMVKQIVESGFDGIICTNTTIDRPDSLQSTADVTAEMGGLSGKPLLKKSNETLRLVRSFAGRDFPIIAVGGIIDKEGAMEKFALGADLIQIYTGFVLKGNRLINDINKQLISENTRKP